MSIHEAAILGNVGLIRQELQAEPSVDERDENGYTALMYAAQYGHDKAFRTLLDVGADPLAALPSGPNVLAFAVTGGNMNVVRAVLDRGADANTRGDFHPKVLPHHPSPLMDAVSLGKRKVAQMLIEAGADVNFRQANGQTALALARRTGSKSLVRLLEEAGATDSVAPPPTLKPADDIFEAARVGDVAAVKALLDKGLPIDARDAANRTPLTLAAQNGHEEAFRFLWESGADPSAAKPGGPDVLQCAVEGGNESIVRFLLDSGYPADGAHPAVKQLGGFTPLMAASIGGNVRIVQMLLDAGADPNVKHVTNTALTIAKLGDNKEIIERLKAAGGTGKDKALAAVKKLEIAAEDEMFQQVLRRLAEIFECEAKPAKCTGVYQIFARANVFVRLAERFGKGADFLKGIAAEERLERRAELLWLVGEEVRADGYLLINSQIQPSTKLLLFPTSDPYVVLAARRTNGANQGLTTSDVIAWLRELEKTHPFVLTACGHDFLTVRPLEPIIDAAPLAKRMVDFCPDLLDGDLLDSPEVLARELAASQELCFWWD